MRRELNIELDTLRVIDVPAYGEDIVIGSENVVGDMIDWLYDSGFIDDNGQVKKGLRASVAFMVTDE